MSVLKTIREEKGYTQHVLAEKTGLSLRTIQRLESTNKVPKGYTLKVLAEEFGTEPDSLKTAYENVKRSTELEISILKMMNLSILSFLGIPFGNLIFPLLIWRKNRHLKLIKETGNRIVNFQILFMLLLCIILILTPFTLSKWFPRTPMVLIIALLAYLFNIIVVLRVASKISSKQFDFLSRVYRFI